MNYNYCIINGKRLKDLWVNKRPEYLTKGQLQFIFNEIDNQKNGAGAGKGFNDYSLKSEYWNNYPGIEIN